MEPPILLSVSEPTSNEQTDDTYPRLRRELARELALVTKRLAKANGDVQQLTTTAMDLARRLDESETHNVTLRGEVAELKRLSQEQATTISDQKAYIQRLRQQVERPARLMAKKALRPVHKAIGRGR